VDIKDKAASAGNNPTEKLSPFREAFHDFANAMNGINGIGYTYAFYLNDLKDDELNPRIEEDASRKMVAIDDYYKKAEAGLKTISQLLNKPDIFEDCRELISNVAERISEMGVTIQDVKNVQGKIQDYCVRGELVRLATELQKLPDQAQVAAGLARDLKTKLVDMGKYYSL